jgi:hypothetical protein
MLKKTVSVDVELVKKGKKVFFSSIKCSFLPFFGCGCFVVCCLLFAPYSWTLISLIVSAHTFLSLCDRDQMLIACASYEEKKIMDLISQLRSNPNKYALLYWRSV